MSTLFNFGSFAGVGSDSSIVGGTTPTSAPVGAPTVAVPTSAAPPSSSSDNGDSSGWLSGLADVFSAAGSAVGAGLKAANAPNTPTAGSGWVYNPATGQYYNPLTGQALTSTGTLTSAAGLGLSGLTGNNSIVLILLVLVAFLFFRPKER